MCVVRKPQRRSYSEYKNFQIDHLDTKADVDLLETMLIFRGNIKSKVLLFCWAGLSSFQPEEFRLWTLFFDTNTTLSNGVKILIRISFVSIAHSCYRYKV